MVANYVTHFLAPGLNPAKNFVLQFAPRGRYASGLQKKFFWWHRRFEQALKKNMAKFPRQDLQILQYIGRLPARTDKRIQAITEKISLRRNGRKLCNTFFGARIRPKILCYSLLQGDATRPDCIHFIPRARRILSHAIKKARSSISCASQPCFFYLCVCYSCFRRGGNEALRGGEIDLLHDKEC